MHLFTFTRNVDPLWLGLPFVLMFAVVICGVLVKNFGIQGKAPSNPWFGITLFVYAIATFIYVYKVTDGASSVGMANGQYVSMYKSHAIRTITQQEYLYFPSLWTRVMSA